MRAGKPTDWITYDWTVRNERALFSVDTSYTDVPNNLETLVYCVIAPLDESAEVFSPKEIKRMERFEKKIKKALSSSAYVGYILMDALKQHYFYVREEEEALSALEEMIDGEKKLCVTAGSAEEPDWLTYYELLLPDAAKFQTTLNAKLIENQRLAGDALNKVRRISFLMCFPTDQERQLFNEDARYAGFAIGDPSFQPELSLSHVQTLFALSALDKWEIDRLTTRAILAAEPHGGELLRWVCPKMSKKNLLS